MSGKAKIERLNADIPKELKRRLKVHCATHGIDIKDFVTEALTKQLDEAEKDTKT